MLNFVLALLAKYTSMTPEEAEAIAKKLNHSIQPAKYEEAVKVVERVLADLEKK